MALGVGVVMTYRPRYVPPPPRFEVHLHTADPGTVWADRLASRYEGRLPYVLHRTDRDELRRIIREAYYQGIRDELDERDRKRTEYRSTRLPHANVSVKY